MSWRAVSKDRETQIQGHAPGYSEKSQVGNKASRQKETRETRGEEALSGQ